MEYCLNCGKKMPKKIREIRNSDEYDKLAKKFPYAWMPLGDWVEILLDPEKTREQLLFVFLCPKCKRELKKYLNENE